MLCCGRRVRYVLGNLGSIGQCSYDFECFNLRCGDNARSVGLGFFDDVFLDFGTVGECGLAGGFLSI